jgi:hypothetical protein
MFDKNRASVIRMDDHPAYLVLLENGSTDVVVTTPEDPRIIWVSLQVADLVAAALNANGVGHFMAVVEMGVVVETTVEEEDEAFLEDMARADQRTEEANEDKG